ncbi:MAG: tyrosine--tRNA ligase [Pseudomonadota bacterium]
MSDFINILRQRGFINQCSDEDGLLEYLKSGKASAYIGFDCTAPSLHVGSLVQIMMMRWFQKCGHKPIALMGGGTTKVGDPSGKDESRKLLTAEMIDQNMAGIRSVFERFLTFGDEPSDAIMSNNALWLDALNYIDFLRDYGRHFTINRMLTFDSVRLRLDREQPLTFLEFNYMMLQAYDYLELYRRHDCRLQMGGSDQWGNIINGIELGRRVEGASMFALTTPLLTTASGAKMGKTAEGAIWLNADMLSPYDYWQYWRNTEDADVGRFLKLFTELDLGEVERLAALEGREINDAKIVLANEATKLLHGSEASEKAEATARETFEAGQTSSDLPTVSLGSLTPGETGLLTIMVEAGLANSNGEARRLIKGGGVKINDTAINDERRTIAANDFIHDGALKLSVGKKKHVLVSVG